MKFSYVPVISIKPPQLLFYRNERNSFQLKEIEKNTDEIASGAILINFLTSLKVRFFQLLEFQVYMAERKKIVPYKWK
jgi:hypothetical protein